jgi:hypothetical protein
LVKGFPRRETDWGDCWLVVRHVGQSVELSTFCLPERHLIVDFLSGARPNFLKCDLAYTGF